ncbi:hypothetical protein ACP6PL_02405 [Dapis sp. BLCC M126]|uniref:hypothetical protein n=1 Tax=Dapis sp. BLCC M126 TaxID=3400189 RepID=UPI003CFAFFEC
MVTPNLINTLKGGTGNDTLYGSHAGGHGYNSMSGGNGGNNLIIADEGVNILHGGPGNDTLVAAIHPEKTTDNIFLFGFGDGNDCIEKGLNHIDVGLTSTNNFTDGIRFVYGSGDDYDYPSDAPTIDSPDQVRDILQFGEGVSAANVRVSYGKDSEHTEPNGTPPYTDIDQQVTFSLIVDDTRVFDAGIDDDLTKPNLQTGDSIAIKGNWSRNYNYSHRIKTLRFGDGSSLEIAYIDILGYNGDCQR